MPAWVLAWGAGVCAQEAPTRPLAEALTVVPTDGACLTRAALVERVGRWLGHADVDSEIEVELHAGVDAEAVWFLMRRAGKRSAERTFDVLPAECAAKVDAVSLAIALAIDHTVLDRLGAASEAQALAPTAPPAQTPPPPPAPPPAAAPAAAPEPRRVGPAAVTATPQAASAVALSAHAGGFAAFALLPDPALGIRLGGGLRVGPTWGVRLDAFATTETASPVGLGDAAMRILAGAASGCSGSAVDVLRLDACAGLAAGAMQAAGRRFPMALETGGSWLAAVLGASAAVPANSPVALRLRIEGEIPMVRPGVHVEDSRGRITDEVSLPVAGVLVGLEVVAGTP